MGVIGSNKSLATLTPSDIDALVNSLLTKAPGTINRYLSAFHTMLAWGLDRGYIKSIPKFSWQTEEEGRIRWITEDEEHRLYKALGESPVALVVKVAIRTGMRRNELLGLPRDSVEKSWVRLWKTKTNHPRSIPISEETYNDLQILLQDMLTLHRAKYLYPNYVTSILWLPTLPAQLR